MFYHLWKVLAAQNAYLTTSKQQLFPQHFWMVVYSTSGEPVVLDLPSLEDRFCQWIASIVYLACVSRFLINIRWPNQTAGL